MYTIGEGAYESHYDCFFVSYVIYVLFFDNFDNYLPGTQYSQEFHSFQPDESGIQPRYNIWATMSDNLINQGQVKVTLGKHDLAVSATRVVIKIWNSWQSPCFWG